MFCPKCGAENKDGMPFCGKCGNQLGTAITGSTGMVSNGAIPGNSTEKFSFMAFFFWFFVLLKEKMTAAAIISLLLVIIPIGYYGVNRIASDDLDLVEGAVTDDINECTEDITSALREVIHKMVGAIPEAGGLLDTLGGPIIDGIVDSAGDELNSTIYSIVTDSLGEMEELGQKYKSGSYFWGIVSIIAMITICIFWGRRYNYYLELQRKGIPFLCAIGDPSYRKI